jgi:hypothetical protein
MSPGIGMSLNSFAAGPAPLFTCSSYSSSGTCTPSCSTEPHLPCSRQVNVSSTPRKHVISIIQIASLRPKTRPSITTCLQQHTRHHYDQISEPLKSLVVTCTFLQRIGDQKGWCCPGRCVAACECAGSASARAGTFSQARTNQGSIWELI